MTDITDRARTQQALRFRLDLEERVTRISTELINLEPEEIDPAINRALADISDLARADRSYVFLYSPDGRTMSNTHEYCRSGIPPVQQTLQAVPISTFPWFQAMIQQHDAILIDRVDDLEPEAAAEKQEFQREGIQSLLCVPMICKDRIMGFVGFDRVRNAIHAARNDHTAEDRRHRVCQRTGPQGGRAGTSAAHENPGREE